MFAALMVVELALPPVLLGLWRASGEAQSRDSSG